MKVMETVNVVIDKSSDCSSEKGIEELTKEILPLEPRVVQEIVEQEPAFPSTPGTPSVVEDSADITTSPDSESREEKGPSSRIKLNHPPEDIVGNLNELILRKRTVDKCVTNFVSYSCYLPQFKPTKVVEAFQDKSWVKAMHDELLHFQRNDVWALIPRPEGEHIIGTKWIFRNKTDKQGNVIHNKARLMAQGYSNMKGVDYDETFAPAARMESIRILLALACHLKFKLYQMDVKTAFLNGFLKEDVYVAQPKGFIDPHFPNRVLYLKKVLYGLKQAPRTWYDRLTQYLVSHRFTRGKVNQTLFIKKEDGELIVAQVYVDDIIFRSTKGELAYSFSKLMQAKFEMSMIRELNHFLGLQIHQQKPGIFLS